MNLSRRNFLAGVAACALAPALGRPSQMTMSIWDGTNFIEACPIMSVDTALKAGDLTAGQIVHIVWKPEEQVFWTVDIKDDMNSFTIDYSEDEDMNIIERIARRFLPVQQAVLKEMPPALRDMKLDERLLALGMVDAHKPRPVPPL